MSFQKLKNLIGESSDNSEIERHIEELTKSSKKVIKDCQIENGAIVAANSDKSYYPENVSNYRFVWPRDAGFTLYAADILGLEDLEEDFYNWLMERAEGFTDSGLIFHRYSTNGPRDTDFGHQYQPDQAATLLWQLLETNDQLNSRKRKVVHLLADGLWDQWDETHFSQKTHDLWEERETFDDYFVYTVASCAKSLEKAANRMDEQKWRKTAEQMKERLRTTSTNRKGKEYYPRTNGEINYNTLDSSIIGLGWPFEALETGERFENTLELIEEELRTEKGVMRYPGDMYDGVVRNTSHCKKGAGYWPLLGFWHVKVLSRLGRQRKAERIFKEQINAIEGEYIPEQIFEDSKKESVSPLAWSHSMFVIAAEELGYIQ